MTHVFTHPDEVKQRVHIELPLVAIAGILTLMFPTWVDNPHWLLILFCASLGLCCFRMTYQILRLIPYLNTEIQVDPVGFTLTSADGNFIRHLWQEVDDAYYDRTSQVMVVEDARQQPLFVVSEQINDFPDLEKAIRQHALICL
ncbi:hypothetical protein [Ferrimonas sp.]|uniref:hypothetical protein n=1 Tax=Ferrimonas sp. TaxID=2080861 RepID=UPI003A921B42